MATLLADGSDFFDRTIPAVSISPSTAVATGGLPREICAFVHIFDDELYEEVESFELHLLLDPLVELSGVILEPNVATVCIEDDDGKNL